MNEDEEWLHPIEGLPPDPTNLPSGCSFNPRCPYATEACRKGEIENAETPDGHLCRCLHIAEVLKKEDK